MFFSPPLHFTGRNVSDVFPQRGFDIYSPWNQSATFPHLYLLFEKGSVNNLHVHLWLPLHPAAALHHSASLEDERRAGGCLSLRTEARLYVALVIKPPHATGQL